MNTKSWIFSRLPARDYVWQPLKPPLPQILLLWLEALPPALASIRRSEGFPPVQARFVLKSCAYEITASVADEKDEFGRKTARVRIEESGIASSMARRNEIISAILESISSAAYSESGAVIFGQSLAAIRAQGLSFYFGPEHALPTGLSVDVIITENGAKFSFPPQRGTEPASALNQPERVSPAKSLFGRIIGEKNRSISNIDVAASRLENDVMLVLRRSGASHAALEINGKFVAVFDERGARQLLKVVEAMIPDTPAGSGKETELAPKI